MVISCSSGCGKRAILKRPKTGDALCKECFFCVFEEEVHHTITAAKLFTTGEYVAIAASGGKDSTVLAHLMTLLNQRYNYGLKLALLSIDEGITGYRDDSLETVKRNEKHYGIPLTILSYQELYGWTMDTIVQKVGRKNNCTFCGVFRRQALDRGAVMMGVDKIVTGHNADDIAETIVMNILRGDVARLNRCCAVQTGSEGSLSRSKPFKYTYEKEIVMYAYFKKLDYFSTECIYSPNAYRGHARAYIKDLEKIRPSAIIDIIHSGECLSIKEGVKMATMSVCTRCGHISSQAVCKACVLLEGLNKGRPRLGVGKSSKVTARMKINPMDLVGELPPSSESADGDKHTNFSEERNASVAELAVASQLENVAETEPSKTSQPDEGSPTVNHLTVDLLASSLTECTVSSSCNESTLIDERSHKKEIFINVRNTSAVTPVIREKANIKNCIEEIEDSNMDSNLVISENQSISEHSSVTKIGKSLPVRRVFSPRKKEQISQNGATVDDFTSSESQPGNKCSSQATSIEDIGNNAGGKVCESGGQCSGNCEKKTEKARKVVSLKHNPESPLKTAGISKKDIEF